MPTPPDARDSADARERTQLIVLGAAIAAHALVASGRTGELPPAALATAAFDLAEAFMVEAEKRYGKVPT